MGLVQPRGAGRVRLERGAALQQPRGAGRVRLERGAVLQRGTECVLAPMLPRHSGVLAFRRLLSVGWRTGMLSTWHCGTPCSTLPHQGGGPGGAPQRAVSLLAPFPLPQEIRAHPAAPVLLFARGAGRGQGRCLHPAHGAPAGRSRAAPAAGLNLGDLSHRRHLMPHQAPGQAETRHGSSHLASAPRRQRAGLHGQRRAGLSNPTDPGQAQLTLPSTSLLPCRPLCPHPGKSPPSLGGQGHLAPQGPGMGPHVPYLCFCC